MEYREIEVTVLSAQHLRNVNLLGGMMNPYAEVWIYSSKKEHTGVCSGGGTNPAWNCALRLACEDRLFLRGGEISIAVYNRGSWTSSNALIGTVTVALSDLIALLNAADDSDQANASMAMSYQVRTRSGKAQGVLHLNVKVGAMVKQVEGRYTPPPGGDHDTTPVMGYPAAGSYPWRLLTALEKKPRHYPPEYHPRYGQPAALYQQDPSLKLSSWQYPSGGPHGTDGSVPSAGCGGGCGG